MFRIPRGVLKCKGLGMRKLAGVWKSMKKPRFLAFLALEIVVIAEA
jgi:hypothetical protein